MELWLSPDEFYRFLSSPNVFYSFLEFLFSADEFYGFWPSLDKFYRFSEFSRSLDKFYGFLPSLDVYISNFWFLVSLQVNFETWNMDLP